MAGAGRLPNTGDEAGAGRVPTRSRRSKDCAAILIQSLRHLFACVLGFWLQWVIWQARERSCLDRLGVVKGSSTTGSMRSFGAAKHLDLVVGSCGAAYPQNPMPGTVGLLT
jgi:hypothetical protein